VAIVLGYKRTIGDESPYWYGEVHGGDRQFIRMVVGVSVPIMDRVTGACVVVGEVFNKANPVDLWAIDAAVGRWPELENGLLQFRRDLKFDHVICDSEQAESVLRRRNDLWRGISEIPISCYAAAPYALTEIGRARAAQMRIEGRLHMDEVENILNNWDPEPSRIALQIAVCWLMDRPAIYSTRQPHRGIGRILGLDGL
jgi:hypothetical protein